MADDGPAPAGSPLRVVIANLPRAVSDALLRLLPEQRDLRLVGVVQGAVEVLLAVANGADVLVLGAPQCEPPPGLCSHLLGEFPHLRILVLTLSGDSAMLYWLGLRRQRVRDATPSALLASIRTLDSVGITARSPADAGPPGRGETA